MAYKLFVPKDQAPEHMGRMAQGVKMLQSESECSWFKPH